MQNIFFNGLLRRARHGLGIVALLAATAGAAHAQIPAATFGPELVFGAGGIQTDAVKVADVNRDGQPDIIAANSFGNTVGVLLATSTGPRIFGTVATYTTGGNSPSDVAVADVDGDGKLDILAANSASGTVGVLLGTGTGAFGLAGTFSTGAGSRPTSIAVADVNGDGKPDVITTNYVTNVAAVLLGTGTGTFGPATTYSTGGSNPLSIEVADVNGDGKPDLIMANLGNSTAGVLLNTGTGTFGPAATYGTGSTGRTGTTDVAVADVSGDGLPDLVTTNYDNSTVGVLLGTGGGSFGAATTYGAGGYYASAIAVADVNGDGKPDLLVAITGGSAGVLLGTGTGTFQAATSFGIGRNGVPVDIVAADLNGDGKPDILMADGGSGGSASTVSVRLNTTVYAPVLTAISPASAAAGATITLTGTSLTGATAVSFYGTPAAAFTVVNATTITATVPAGALSGNVTVTGPGGTSNGLLFTRIGAVADLVINTPGRLIPAGAYNSITINSPGVGTLTGPVTVASAVTVNSGATLNDGCFVIGGAGSFTLAAGGTLGICAAQGISSSGATGTVQTTGGRSFSSDANYVYNGATAQNTGSGLPAQVRSLTTTNPTPLTLSAPLGVAQTLTVGAAGNLVTAGNALTLLSNASGTALVVNSSTGVVSGAATVQRYIDPTLNGGLGYHHYSSPVTGTTVADLATPSFTPLLNPVYNTSLTPTAETPFPNVYGYDERRGLLPNNVAGFDKGFFSPASLADPLVPGRAYAVNIAASQLVDFVGTLTNGDLPVPLTCTRPANPDGGYQLLGNPYPAPLNYDLVDPTDRVGLEPAIYVYQSASQYGGRYRTYVNGIGNPVLPVGQGFFMRVVSGLPNATFTFRNSQRLTTPTGTTFLRSATDPRPQVQLELAGASLTDTFYAYAEAGATPAFDAAFDAVKLPNPSGLNLASLATSGESLAIDGRPIFDAATTLPLTVGVPAAGTYTLGATSLANLPAGLDAYLADAQTGQTVRLASGTSYAFSVSATQAASLVIGRFRLLFRPATALATVPVLTAESVSVYPNPAHERFTVLLPGLGQATTVQAELLTALGQVVRRQVAALPATGTQLTLDAAGLAAGVYTLRLQAGNATLAKRVVVQ